MPALSSPIGKNLRLYFAATLLAISTSCEPMQEEEGSFIEGATMPANWNFDGKKKLESHHRFSNGEEYTLFTYDFSDQPPFSAYCGKEVTFSPACAIKRVDHVAGTSYSLIDHQPLPGGVVNLYSMPVQKGKLLAVRGRCSWIDSEKVFIPTGCTIEALLEVYHPDTSVNGGKPLYLVYNLGHEPTKRPANGLPWYEHIKRAPWEPDSTPATRSIYEPFYQAEKSRRDINTKP